MLLFRVGYAVVDINDGVHGNASKETERVYNEIDVHLMNALTKDLNHWKAGLLHMMALANIKVPVTNAKGEYLHKGSSYVRTATEARDCTIMLQNKRM